jgi:CRP-like cAMP-binding protein
MTLTRTTDPDTSHEAARLMDTTGAAAAHRARCLQAVRLRPGSTAAEIAKATGLERHEPSRRLPELRTAGLVVNGASRICEVQGNRSMTWHPVEASA